MRVLLALAVVACGHREAPNTVTGLMSINGAAVAPSCELAPADPPQVTLTLVSAKGRVRIVEHANDNDSDVFLDDKPMPGCALKADGSSGHETRGDGPEYIFWRGHLAFDCMAGDVRVAADLTVDCGH